MQHTLGGLMGIGSAVFMAAVVLVSYQAFREPMPEMPRAFSFTTGPEAGTILVVRAPANAHWDELRVAGCALVPSGPVFGGQRLGGCGNPVTIYDLSTDQMLFTSHA